MKNTIDKLSVFLLIILCGCNQVPPQNQDLVVENGQWRGVVGIQGKELPFIFEKNGAMLVIHNGEERLNIDSITYFGDSVSIPMHIFDARIVAKIFSDKLEGYWIKDYLPDYKLPFSAKLGKAQRFGEKSQFSKNISGKWRVIFINEQDTSPALAVFDDNEEKLTGTFLTPTGDYRYLEGVHVADKLQLSAFDGSHAFLFDAEIAGDTIKGMFRSGKSWQEKWIAVRDENYVLPDPEKLTYINEGYDGVDFSFPLPNGEMVSPNDKQFDGKVLIIQLLGSWCPNCMDESKFFVEWMKKNTGKDVAILGLAYEAKDDFKYAVSRISKMKKRLGIDYPIAIAGTKDKKEALKTLPMLNSISSFPTTIILDKNKKVRKIHTGFSGPGTGKYYEKFVDDFQAFINSLLKEEAVES